MRQFLSSLILLGAMTLNAAPTLSFTGGSGTVKTVQVTPDKSTGYDNIYVVENTAEVVASFKSSNPASVSWFRFGSSGGANAQPAAATVNGQNSQCELTTEDCGYIVEEGTSRFFFWIVNYANSPLELSGASVSQESDCISAMILPQGHAEEIRYYTINGAPRVLDRQIKVSYQTLKYDTKSECYTQTETTASFESLTSEMHVPQPLCDTRFTISGDRFLKAWKKEISVETSYYQALAVDAHTSATQEERDNDNESSDTPSGYGGSAPCTITFKAVVSDAVRFTEWQFASDADFKSIDMRFQQEELEYTFRDYGTFYVRFVASNDAGSCDWASETYEVVIATSKLLCPNAFSPGNQDGVNDEWKVSYESIVEFDCTIFNRWGTKMAHLTDPSQSWDGRYNDKFVPNGVYYYVIKALGADGTPYDLSGDINILNYRQNSTQTNENN